MTHAFSYLSSRARRSFAGVLGLCALLLLMNLCQAQMKAELPAAPSSHAVSMHSCCDEPEVDSLGCCDQLAANLAAFKLQWEQPFALQSVLTWPRPEGAFSGGGARLRPPPFLASYPRLHLLFGVLLD